MTSPADTIREALAWLPNAVRQGRDRRDEALAALTELEQQLANTVPVLAAMAEVARERERAEAAEADRDRLADTLRETTNLVERDWSGRTCRDPECPCSAGKVEALLAAARAALDRHTKADT